MTTPFLPFSFHRPLPLLRRARAAAAGLCVAFVAACGGGADAPPPPEGTPPVPPAAVVPVITQQPADLTVVSGQPASFTVAASGTAPLAYQWQRNGADIAGATSTTYSISTTAPTDTGAVFRAVVSNTAGTATSNNATLTVTTAAPVLTITQQPAATSLTAGSPATFTVAATCSAGTLVVQWERSGGAGFTAIAGATALTYTFTTAAGDNNAQFRATLTCSGQSSTSSNAATLGVGAAGGVTVGLLNIANRAAQAGVSQLGGVDRLPDGSTVYTSGNNVIKLSADQENITVIAGDQGTPGNTDGQGAAARFRTPIGIVHDASGNLWVVDAGNNAVRRIAPDGTVTTVATAPALVGGSIAIGPDGDFYLGGANGGVIRRMTPAGVVTTYAGSGNFGRTDGPAATADIGEVTGIAIASNGDLYFSERNSGRIRRVVRSGTVAGNVETIAGNGDGTTTPGLDGVGTAAGIPQPSGLAIAGSTLYVRDYTLIRAIDLTTFAVSTFSGNRVTPTGLKDGPATEAGFPNLNRGVLSAIPGGGLMIGDAVAIRAVDAAGTVKTISSANNQVIAPGGTAVTDRLPFAAGGAPVSLAVDGQHRVVVGTDLLALVRRIDTAGNLEILAGNPAAAATPRDGVGTAAGLSNPGRSIAAAADGTVYFSDYVSVRRIALDGTVTTIAGGFPPGNTVVDGPTGTSVIPIPTSMMIGVDGSVYHTSVGSASIRRTDAAGNTTTFAGSANTRGTADGPLASATFTNTGPIVSAPDGTIYVADGQAIRKITPAGIVSTLRSGVLVSAMTLDPSTGLLYVTFLNGDGISVVDPVTGTSSVVIRSGTALVVGNVEPRVGAVRALAMLGPKQLVICTDVNQLATVTLP